MVEGVNTYAKQCTLMNELINRYLLVGGFCFVFMEMLICSAKLDRLLT